MSAGALLPLVAALVVQAGYTVASDRESADDGLAAKARALANLMVSVVGPSIAFDDDRAVADGLGYVASDPDFAFSAAIGPDGKPIAIRGTVEPQLAGTLTATAHEQVYERDDLFVAAAPVVTDGKQVGTVFVGLRTGDVHARAMHTSEWAAAISILGILIAVIVVQILASKVVQRNKQMRVVLDNVDEALATIRIDGTLDRECSAAFARWFGAPGNGPFHTQIAGSDARMRDMLALGWSELVEGVMPLEVLVDQFPNSMERDGRHFRIDIKPLHDGDKLAGALLRIRDVTAEVEAQKRLAAQQEYVSVFERALADPHGVREFLEDTSRLIASIPNITDPVERKRAAHTVKGNAAIYGVHSVADAAHRLEDRMALDGEADPTYVQELVTAWTAFATRIGPLLGNTGDHVDVSRAELESLIELTERGSGSVLERLRVLALEPVTVRFENIRRQIARVADNLSKPVPQVTVQAAGVRLAADRLRPFWGAFAHVVRNTLDHGIESPEDRIAAGKPEAGQIELDARIDDGTITIAISDDGGGIAWERVRARAAAAGLPTDSHADLERAMFDDGISTAETVTRTSGRGIGLAAVRAAVLELGGSIAVTSEAGRGTRFAFSFPAAAVRTQPVKRATAVSYASQEIAR